MWIINCILLMIGAVAAVFGISFYLRNRDAAGNIKFYMLSYGICSAVWCISYGFIGFAPSPWQCELIRKIGIAGVNAFLVTEAFLASELSGVSGKTRKIIKLTSVLLATIDYLIFSQNAVDLYIRKDGWTTWQANPAHQWNRMVHFGFITFCFFTLFSLAIVWARCNKLKRLRRFLVMVFISNFIMLFFTIPDTVLPQMGLPAVSTSGIGAAACAIVMWYGATQLSSFDLRVGNIRDKLYDFIEAGVIVFDTNREIAIINRYSGQLLGEKNAGNIHFSDFFDIEEADMENMFTESVNEIFTKRLWNKDHTKAYSVRMSAVKDDYGDTFCFMCVFGDVTEEVEAVSKYEIASRAKSRFLAQMSHEIRTPINAVLGMNEMILRESGDNEILEYAENIDSAGKTLLSLINSILDFSKIEDGKMDIVPVKYDTASFINDIYNSIVQRADAKGLDFALEVDESLPCTLVGDDVRFAQVIMNLLTNAVKYTEKGKVTFAIRAMEQNGDSIYIHVSVKDTGIGIREEDKERLFESFERLDEVRNHNIEGTGLGMSIVTSLLGMMGSRLQVISTYGKGSEFYFTISQQVADRTPIGDYQERLKESSHHKDKEDVVHAPNARILLVDDNDMNLKVAGNLLKLCGIRPDKAASGNETIECMKQSAYDIVFLDHMMPGMDGIETLYKLKRDNLVPEHTAMIALTANAVVGARETYLEAGFDDYLSKPIEIKHLVEKLKKYLPDEAYKEQQEPDAKPAIDLADETASYMQILKDAGIDVNAGKSYCGNEEEMYMEMLGDYATSFEEKQKVLNALFHDNSWQEYGIRIHALKSNVKMIGALAVAQEAEKLEKAAKSSDARYLKEHHDAVLKACGQLADRIRMRSGGHL